MDFGQPDDIVRYISHLRDCRPMQSKAEQEAASVLVESLGFQSHHDRQKNWDTFKCMAYVVGLGDPSQPVLDAGSGLKCVVLQWLAKHGYTSLHACDIRPAKTEQLDKLGISFTKQDITQTTYPDSYFQAVTCISVIEHNVPLQKFCNEMARVLKPGGLLLVSTDYWSEPVDCTGIFPYGEEMGEMMIFNAETLGRFVSYAAEAGLQPCAPISYDTGEKVVLWERVAREYTFAFVAFEKRAA